MCVCIYIYIYIYTHTHIYIYIYFFFFCRMGFEFSFTFTKQVLYHLSHTSNPFCFDYFGDRVSPTVCPGWLWNLNPPDLSLPSSKNYRCEPPTPVSLNFQSECKVDSRISASPDITLFMDFVPERVYLKVQPRTDFGLKLWPITKKWYQ
jgi:hypothetical protein